MNLTDLFALLVAGLTLAAAGLVIFSRNAIYAAFYLLLTLLGVACEYALLQAHFIAVIQVLVYAGAVVVLIVFVLMMMGFGRDKLASFEISGSALVLPIILGGTFALAGGVSLFSGKLLQAPPIKVVSQQQTSKAHETKAHHTKKHAAKSHTKSMASPTKPAPTGFGSIDVVGLHLITHNVLAFEVISVLLLMAMVGVILILRERKLPERPGSSSLSSASNSNS